jgi:hypothetical protein
MLLLTLAVFSATCFCASTNSSSLYATSQVRTTGWLLAAGDLPDQTSSS